MITLTPVELEDIHSYLRTYMHTEEAQSMKTFCQHMWPLTLRAIPTCRESVIVCISDKVASTVETLFQRK